MRLGVNLGYWGLGLTSADQLALALEAEAAGFDGAMATTVPKTAPNVAASRRAVVRCGPPPWLTR